MRILKLVGLMFIVTHGAAQNNEATPGDVGKLAEDMLTFQDENVDYENQNENYAQIFSTPVNLNRATIAELRLPGILTDQQIEDLIDHIDKYGSLLSIYELQTIPSFDLATIEKLAPFVVVTDPRENIDRSLLNRVADSDIYFLARWERKLGNQSSEAQRKFKGSADKFYYKMRASSPTDYSIGVTLEKDAVEQFVWAPKKYYYGVDYVSAHAQIQNKKFIKNFIVGDFQYQFGQGIILGSGFGFGKGAETVTAVRKSNIGFLPYMSANEAGYMRGGAITVKVLPRIYISSFVSTTKRDGNLNDDSTSFSSIQITGLHTTESELANRKVINETNVGGVAEYKKGTTEFGVIFNSIDYSIPSIKKSNAYNQFAFEGSKNLNGGAYFSTTVNNVSVFAEGAQTYHGGVGFIVGALSSLGRSLDAAILWRKYDRDFHSFYSNALSENSRPGNETGIYWGMKYKISRRYTLSGYVDLFRFPWLKFGVYRPSQGNEIFGRLQFQPSKKTVCYVQWRREQKEKNAPADAATYQMQQVIKTNICINADYHLTDKVRMKSRFQASEISAASKTSGMALIQDMIIRLSKMKITARYALFDTDDFDNRQYVYENDMLMAFSFPAYQNTGTRKMIMIEYKFVKALSMWLRYAETTEVADIYGNRSSSKVLKCQIVARL